MGPNAQTGSISSLAPLSGAQDASARCPSLASSSHATSPVVPVERQVLLTVPTGWGQAPGTISERVTMQQDSVVSLAQPRLFAHVWVPQEVQREQPRQYGLTAGEVSSRGILSAVTRKKRMNTKAGGHNIDNHQN